MDKLLTGRKTKSSEACISKHVSQFSVRVAGDAFVLSETSLAQSLSYIFFYCTIITYEVRCLKYNQSSFKRAFRRRHNQTMTSHSTHHWDLISTKKSFRWKFTNSLCVIQSICLFVIWVNWSFKIMTVEGRSDRSRFTSPDNHSTTAKPFACASFFFLHKSQS